MHNIALLLMLRSAVCWTQGFSRRQLLEVAGYATVTVVATSAVAEDVILAPVEVSAMGDAKKVRCLE